MDVLTELYPDLLQYVDNDEDSPSQRIASGGYFWMHQGLECPDAPCFALVSTTPRAKGKLGIKKKKKQKRQKERKKKGEKQKKSMN